MLAADYHEKIGELVVGIVLSEYGLSICPCSDVVIAYITTVSDTHRGEAEILWPDEPGILEATVEALKRALEGL